MVAEKLLWLFCRVCQRVMSVSTAMIFFCTSFTATSIGTGVISMDSTIFRGKSISSAINSSLIKFAYSRRKRTRPT